MKERTTDPFQALADPSRRAILIMLAQKSHTINAIAENFDMSRPAVSKHIKMLCAAGFIAITDTGRERHCTLNKDGFNNVRKWINFFDGFWNEKLKNLEQLMNSKKK